jgi:hypothetical protein
MNSIIKIGRNIERKYFKTPPKGTFPINTVIDNINIIKESGVQMFLTKRKKINNGTTAIILIIGFIL